MSPFLKLLLDSQLLLRRKHVTLQVVSGGLCCQSGVAIAELGDKNDDMLIAVAAVTVGY